MDNKPQRKHPETPLEAAPGTMTKCAMPSVESAGKCGGWDTPYGIGYSDEKTPPPRKVTVNSPPEDEYPTEEDKPKGIIERLKYMFIPPSIEKINKALEKPEVKPVKKPETPVPPGFKKFKETLRKRTQLRPEDEE